MAGEETHDLKRALQSFFGFENFRPFQKEAIEGTLSKKDVLLVLPTGGGKSLTFQLPVLTLPNKFTVVICPLIALSKDQVNACLERDIDAELWNSEASEIQKKRIESEICSEEPSLKLLYTTPESLWTPRLQKALQVAWEQGTLFSFAIDEAHCVSTWGHDFRPAYLGLSSLKENFKEIPIIALTATCTIEVQKSISEVLALKSPIIIKASFNRSNIAYQVRFKELIGDGSKESALKDVADYIRSQAGGNGIIYARLRKTCDWLASELGAMDIDATCYHAGKDMAVRNKVLSFFQEGSVEVVVATIAFGMGIDKPDVRWVVHWDPPSSLEGFYQESGRAGRDGEPSESVMYVSQEELEKIKKLERGVRAGAVSEVASYAMNPRCRRKSVLEYFRERRGGCDGDVEALCDYCKNPKAAMQTLTRLEQKTETGVAQPNAGENPEAGQLPPEELQNKKVGTASSRPIKPLHRHWGSQSKENLGVAGVSWQSADQLLPKRSLESNREQPGKILPVVKRRKRNFNPPRIRTAVPHETTAPATLDTGRIAQNNENNDQEKSKEAMERCRRRFKPPVNSRQER
ncbi:hypothetical protein BSKO_04024 [Bryopsis sp. KO-2023]|nr:hypothetical protein BSKO_04024 [Bryopsis sp. KO-2023]